MPSLPRKWVEERDPSPDARHCDVALTTCDAPLTIRISRSAMPDSTHLVLYRCEVCDAECFTRHESAPAVKVVPVVMWLDEPVTLYDNEPRGPEAHGV